MYDRLENLYDVKLLENKNILLVGVGGVGSYTFEALIRSGIKNITIIDFDTYEESNLNRQLNSTKDVIGHKKVDVLKKHALSINPDINVTIVDEFINKDSIIDYNKYDFIIDACDSMEAKVLLITKAKEYNKKIITSMGIGNRLNPTSLEINTINNVIGDPLAKKLRKELKNAQFDSNIRCVCSKELPIKGKVISSYMPVTAYAGLLIADYVIKELIND